MALAKWWAVPTLRLMDSIPGRAAERDCGHANTYLTIRYGSAGVKRNCRVLLGIERNPRGGAMGRVCESTLDADARHQKGWVEYDPRYTGCESGDANGQRREGAALQGDGVVCGAAYPTCRAKKDSTPPPLEAVGQCV